MAERLVVIGGDAGGMAAASQARRLRADLDIIALEKGPWTSYSACGIPYLVAGDVGRVEDLVARSPQEFRDRFRIDVRTRHEVVGVDLDARTVEVRDLERGRTLQLPFELLMFGTGARPIRPDLPGIDADWVHGVQTLDDASHLLARVRAGRCGKVTVVGGGYIGLEMAEAFVRHGASVTLVEAAPEVMRTLDPDLGRLVSDALRDLGVDVRLDTPVLGFEPGRVVTGNGSVDTDLAVLGLGVQPNAELAADAGIATGVRGAITVDDRQRTSADGVYAAGDCADVFHQVSRRRVHVALGTVANKTARVAGINLGGGYARMPGVVGTAVTKVCQHEVGRTGLTEHEAELAGFAYRTATVTSTDRAAYFPGVQDVTVKLLAEEGTGRLLGGQIVGGRGAAKRVDVLATALTAGLGVHDLFDLDLGYAPPLSPLWDPVQSAARRLLH